MAIAEVTTNRASNQGLSTTASVTYAASPAAGSLMVAVVYARAAGGLPTTIPSGWSLVSSRVNGLNDAAAMYYKIAGSSEPTSASWTIPASVNWVVCASNWTGIETVSPVDVSSSTGGTAVATTETGAIGALATANELVVIGWCNNNIFTWSGQTQSQVELVERTSTGGTAANRNNVSLCAVIVSSTASVNYAATLSTAGNWSVVWGTFKQIGSTIVASGSFFQMF